MSSKKKFNFTSKKFKSKDLTESINTNIISSRSNTILSSQIKEENDIGNLIGNITYSTQIYDSHNNNINNDHNSNDINVQKKNVIDNINDKEENKLEFLLNQNEDIDFINTYLKLKGVPFDKKKNFQSSKNLDFSQNFGLEKNKNLNEVDNINNDNDKKIYNKTEDSINKADDNKSNIIIDDNINKANGNKMNNLTEDKINKSDKSIGSSSICTSKIYISNNTNNFGNEEDNLKNRKKNITNDTLTKCSVNSSLNISNTTTTIRISSITEKNDNKTSTNFDNNGGKNILELEYPNFGPSENLDKDKIVVKDIGGPPFKCKIEVSKKPKKLENSPKFKNTKKINQPNSKGKFPLNKNLNNNESTSTNKKNKKFFKSQKKIISQSKFETSRNAGKKYIRFNTESEQKFGKLNLKKQDNIIKKKFTFFNSSRNPKCFSYFSPDKGKKIKKENLKSKASSGINIKQHSSNKRKIYLPMKKDKMNSNSNLSEKKNNIKPTPTLNLNLFTSKNENKNKINFCDGITNTNKELTNNNFNQLKNFGNNGDVLNKNIDINSQELDDNEIKEIKIIDNKRLKKNFKRNNSYNSILKAEIFLFSKNKNNKSFI